jgi:hypothetical protein
LETKHENAITKAIGKEIKTLNNKVSAKENRVVTKIKDH